MSGNVNKFVSSEGRCIYTFPVTVFPTLVANIYIIDDGDRLTLIDSGSGMDFSNQEFVVGFGSLKDMYNLTFSLADLDAILITHGHTDHFGGLPFLRQFTQAPVGMHILDKRVLTNYGERVILASHRLNSFLISAGVSEKHRQGLMGLYLWAKDRFQAQPVDFLLSEETVAPGDFQVYHVPGHCPGQVCLRVDDILLTADHVLSRITPHQAPESITNNMGLGHYLESLAKIARLDGVSLGLGGHEDPILDLPARIEAIKVAHDRRLDRTLEICQEPHTIAEISKALFGKVESYHVLLALEEAGAHVEYLHQRDELVAVNLAEIEGEAQPVIRYIQA